MNIDGMHVLSVIPPDHTVGIMFGVFFAIAAIMLLFLIVQVIYDGEYGFAFLFGIVAVCMGCLSYLAYTVYTPEQYKVTIPNLSHFNYQHWKIVDQDGEILTVEKIGGDGE